VRTWVRGAPLKREMRDATADGVRRLRPGRAARRRSYRTCLPRTGHVRTNSTLNRDAGAEEPGDALAECAEYNFLCQEIVVYLYEIRTDPRRRRDRRSAYRESSRSQRVPDPVGIPTRRDATFLPPSPNDKYGRGSALAKPHALIRSDVARASESCLLSRALRRARALKIAK
jgi:hypothetical protein